MRSYVYSPISAALLLGLVGGTPAVAQMPNAPWIQMQSTSINFGLGGQFGDGTLHLPNLGTNCSYPFTVRGFGAGIHVGVSAMSASGTVRNMTRVADLAGNYGATQGEFTVVGGAGAISMMNYNNNVAVDFNGRTWGLGLGAGGQGMTINIDAPVPNAPSTYVLQFSFDKASLSRESRAALDQLISAWKCHYADFQMVGHTDTVGGEGSNLQLSASRAQAARDYLVSAGVVPTRIATHAVGENDLLVPTGPDVRLRANRAVVITVTAPASSAHIAEAD
jgi:hypothetical protein